MTDNIVILGASYAGINTAHYLLKFVLPAIGSKYHVLLVNPTTDLFHRISAPRSLVSTELLPETKTFFDIQDGFKQYGGKNFTFVQGKATNVDSANQSIVVELSQGGEQVITYHALVIATGAKSLDPVLSFQEDDGQETHQALVEMRQRLKTAESVVVGGGGPAGVEVASEIAEFFNGKPGWFSKPQQKLQIQLFTSGDQLLPILRPALGKRAEDMLREMGASTTYNTKITGTDRLSSGKTKVHLSTGKSIETDIYINAIGTRPMTDFLPKAWLDDKGRVKSNGNLRVEAAGPRVYAVGDVGAHSRGGMMNLFESVPVLATNLKTDLLAAAGTKQTTADRTFKGIENESQGVTIGQSRAVGAFNGMKIPGIVIWAMKGRDYFYGQTKSQVSGGQWSKEVAYKAVPIKA